MHLTRSILPALADAKAEGDDSAPADPEPEPVEEPEPEAEPEETPQHQWVQEMRVEVYSRSLKSWLPGTVIEVDDDEINVSYTDGAQRGTKWVDALDAAAVRAPESSEEEALVSLQSVRDGAAAKRKAAAAADEKNWAAELERQKAQWAGKTSPKVGSKGSVFSRSAGRWLACVVVAVGGDEARVKYKLGGQVLQTRLS